MVDVLSEYHRLAHLFLEQQLQEALVWLLERAGVPAEPLRLDQMNPFFDATASWASNLVARYPHVDWGEVEQIGSLWNMGDLPPRLDRASPALGEHSREIFEELNLDPALYASLEAEGKLVGN